MDYSFALFAKTLRSLLLLFFTAKDAKEYSAKSAKSGYQIVTLCASLRKTWRSLRLLFFYRIGH